MNYWYFIGKKTGEVAVLKRGKRFVYYLITKVKATGKPTYDSLRASLCELKKHCVKNGIKSLAMPKIGCGLDRLEWEEVSTMICEIYSDVDIKVTVYALWWLPFLCFMYNIYYWNSIYFSGLFAIKKCLSNVRI